MCGAAALNLKDRDAWFGWTVALRVERLKWVVRNRRYPLLRDQGQKPTLASQALAPACQAQPAQ